MIPSNLAEILPLLLLGLAVVTGLPALFYLAFKGTVREKPEKEAQTKPETTENLDEDAQLVPVLIFVSKSSVERLLSKMQQAPPKPEAKLLETEKPKVEPLIRRVEK